MSPLAYEAVIRQDGPNDFLVTFPDVPEAITQGGTLEEAIFNGTDALDAVLEVYIEQGRDLPPITRAAPSSMGGESAHWVTVGPAVAARALLGQRMRAVQISKTALAARMGRDEKTVRRILAGRSVSLDLTLEALRALGVRPGLAA